MQNILLKKLVIIGSSALTLSLLAGCAQLHQETAATIVKGNATPMKPRPEAEATAKPSTATRQTLPPGAQASTQAIALGSAPQARPVTSKSSHTVQAGETLYRVAVNNGLRYQDVAEWNNLDGYTIKVGQVLRLTPPDAPQTGTPVTAPATGATTMAKPVATQPAANPGPTEAKAPVSGADAQAASKRYPKALKLPYSEEAIKSLPGQSEGNGKAVASVPPTKNTPDKPANKVEANTPVTPAAPAAEASAAKPATNSGVVWGWPTQGSVIRGFSDQNKGIDIAGKMGQPVVAAADGKVVYSGNGLRGYGKLIILRHDKTYLSAYAHNSQLLVKEGQSVKKGQKIAEMGNTDADQVKLHFEVRQLGKPVDPSKYLETRP